MNDEKDLPDNVAPNPHSLPYASNIERFNKLKKEFEELCGTTE